jgi:NAD(P)-dependent dehydrogenase (short-subunit alcohol dehydrogenase family)
MSKVWFITGASRGFGREFVLAALERGDKVAATARNTDTLSDLVEQYGDAVLPVELDVTNRDQVFAAVKSAHETFGRIDVVINNAGYGLFGTVEEITEQQLRDQLETNLFGGSIGWTERTGGVLTARECLTLARPLLRGELSILAGRLAMLLRMHSGRRRSIDPASLVPPDSSLARDAEVAAQDLLTPHRRSATIPVVPTRGARPSPHFTGSRSTVSPVPGCNVPRHRDPESGTRRRLHGSQRRGGTRVHRQPPRACR